MLKEKLIDKEYLKELDKTQEFIPLTFDYVFKGIFERNPEILKRFIISTLNLDLDVNSTKIEILNNELIKENAREYQKRIDIFVVLNDLIYVDIEINRSNFEKVKLRNSMYCDKLYSILLDMGEKTSKLKDIYLYQLNLNTEDKSISYGEDKIVSYSLVTKDIFIQNKYIVLKYLEFYRNLYYTKHESLRESEIWLAALTSKKFTELDEMLSHILTDRDKDKFIRETIRMMKWDFNLHEWNKEKMDELVRDETERIHREEKERAAKEGMEKGIKKGIKKGIEQGIEQGIERGTNQNTIDMIHSMLENNLDLETISKISKKSVEEIKEIAKQTK